MGVGPISPSTAATVSVTAEGVDRRRVTSSIVRMPSTQVAGSETSWDVPAFEWARRRDLISLRLRPRTGDLTAFREITQGTTWPSARIRAVIGGARLERATSCL